MATKLTSAIELTDQVNISGDLIVPVETTNPSSPSKGQLWFNDTNDTFNGYNGSTVVTLSGGSGGSAVGSLDDVYSNGAAITVDNGAITLTDATTGSENTLALVKSGAGSGNIIDIQANAALTGNMIDIDANLGIASKAIYIDCGAGARTGNDIDVKDDSTGNHSVFNIEKSGAGASVGFDYQESYNGSSASFGAKFTLDANDGIDTTCIQAVRGAGIRTAPVIDINDGSTGSAHIIDIDLTGVYTGNIFDFASSAAATGNVLYLELDNAVAMTAIHVRGSGVRTEPYIELIADQTGSADMIDISCDGAFTGDAVAIDMNAAVGANALFIDAGNATRTAPLILTTFDGNGTTTGGTLWDINVTNTGAAANPLFDIDVTGVYTGNIVDVALGAASTGSVIYADMNLGVAAPFATIDAGGTTRTADLFEITFDGDGNVGVFDINVTNTGTGNLIDFDITGIHAGNCIDITYGTAASTGDAVSLAMGTNVAGSALVITGAGSRTDDLIKIDDSSTGNSHIFDINFTGIYTGNCIDITYGTAAATGTAINIATGTNLAGNAIAITTAGARTAPVINVVGAGTDGGTDDHIILITQSGQLDSNMIQLTYDTAASTGDCIGISMGTNVAGSALAINGTGSRTDDLIKIDDDSTGNSHIFDINLTGVYTGNVLDIAYATAAATGNAINISMGTNLAGQAIDLTLTGARTDAGIKVTDDSTANAPCIDLNFSGVRTGNAIDITYGTAAATENAIDLNMGTNVAGDAINIASAGTGDGCGIDIAHTGNLADGSALVKISSTGSPAAADGNIVEIIQATGAGVVGNYALYIKATGANVEGLKVDDGAVVFDETLTVTGATTLSSTLGVTGAATFTAGQQSASVARTATAAPGGTTGVIADGTTFVTVTCDDANKVVTLPTPTPGNIVYITEFTTGFELRSSDPATVAINGGTGANAESAVPSTAALVVCTCISATKWICYMYDADGDGAKVEAAA